MSHFTTWSGGDYIRTGFHRGDYVTTNWIDGHPTDARIIAVTVTVLTMRTRHRWRVVERCHARVEDWILRHYIPLAVRPTSGRLHTQVCKSQRPSPVWASPSRTAP